jgi:hypothetical protein
MHRHNERICTYANSHHNKRSILDVDWLYRSTFPPSQSIQFSGQVLQFCKMRCVRQSPALIFESLEK